MREAFTFDDVLLIPAYNHYESRQHVELSVTDRSGKLALQLPVMTANMDTVTESAMANFIGGKGGIGVLHRMMSIDRNVAEFRRCLGPVFVSVGCAEEELTRAEALRDAGATHFVVDATAPTITKPVMTRLVGSEAPTWASPASRVAMISTPKKVFTTDPRPPIRLVPPITTAAMADSSRPTPALGSEEPSREV